MANGLTAAQALRKARRVVMYLLPAAHPSSIAFAVPKKSVREAMDNDLRNLNNPDLCSWSLGDDGTFHLHWAT